MASEGKDCTSSIHGNNYELLSTTVLKSTIFTRRAIRDSVITITMSTALCVIDMQMIFRPMVELSLKNTLTLISHFKSANLPIIFTQHGHSEDELSGRVPNQIVSRWGREGSVAIGSPDWEFIPDISECVSSITPVIAKNSYDAFVNTRLESLLREQGVQRVVICGTMTDFCCDTSARSAANRGFETWFVADACGTASKEQHEEGIHAFEKLFRQTYETTEVLAELKKWQA